MVALGMFSLAQASPVVPDWTATCVPDTSSAAASVAAEAALTTSAWLEVGVGEVDLLLALVGDGDGAQGHVGLAALLDGRDDGVELHGGQDVGL